jgi:hypothetical protein
MNESGEYRVTRHRGNGPDSKDTKVVFSHRHGAPTMAFYRCCIPPRPGVVVAVWRPDGSLITFTAGGPDMA